MARIAALACIAFMLLAPTTARGAVAVLAPEYESSEPADGEELHRAPDTVSATFSEPLDPGSEMSIEDECGNQIDDGNVSVSLTEMSVGVADQPSGRYHVAFVATGIGGATGSTEGHFTFTVHAGQSCKGGSGGHGGHGGGGGHGGPGGGGSGGHGNHGGGGEGHGSGEHAGMEPGSEHSTHGPDSTSHTDHDQATGSNGNGHANHSRGRSSNKEIDEGLAGIAAGQTPLPDLSPDSTAVLLALLMCAAFGALGGWFLRVSARK